MRKLTAPLRRILALAAVLPVVAAASAADLAHAPSPFLRRGAETPVRWMNWDDAAFSRAQAEGKPIFLAIGLQMSELSRATLRQTFANADTAAFLNETFVSVLVDAKERPDLAELYQNYTQTRQLKGLPLNLWLTPELQPFDGANYLPPTDEWGKEGFSTVARRAAAGWTTDPAAQRAKAAEVVASIKSETAALPPPPSDPKIKELIDEALQSLNATFDPANGGFSEPPKHPEPELLRFLLREPAGRAMAVNTLRAIVNSAVRDPLDGGFFRYAVDAAWHQPYFQKTLADQARLALACLDAAQLTGDATFADAARDALTFALDRLRLPDGDLAAALDLTNEKQIEAQLWTADDIKRLAPDDAETLSRLYGVTANGNIDADAFPGFTVAGKNLLYRAVVDAKAEAALAGARAKLLQERDRRAPALLDDAAPSGVHGLFLAALARAGAEARDHRLAAAAKAEFQFLRERLLDKDGALLRLAGRSFDASAADYAGVALGLVTYATAMNDRTAEELATKLLLRGNADYLNRETGRYYAVRADAGSDLWGRVYATAPRAGESPRAEALALLALASSASLDRATGDTSNLLARAAAAEYRAAAEGFAGDLLLALQSHAAPTR